MGKFYKSNTLLASICVLIIMLIAIDVYVFRSEPLIFWISLPVLLGVSGLALGKLFQIRQSEYVYFEQLSKETDKEGSMWQSGFPLPACIVNSDGNIIRSNGLFDELFFRPNEENFSINDIIENKSVDLFNSEGRDILYHVKDKDGNDTGTKMWFKVYSVIRKEDVNDRTLSINAFPKKGSDRNRVLIFRDITEFKLLQETHENTKPVVMLIEVDDYEELLSEAKESERANITGKVNTLIENYFADKKAAWRRIPGDKFFVVLEQQSLNEMIKNNMDIINLAHEIKIQENTSITLSIGVGTTAQSLAQGERIASKLLKTARERGGDQALVKTPDNTDNFDTYGAASPGNGRTKRARMRRTAGIIMDLIKDADAVYIMGHSYGDYDSAGAAIGLTCAIRKLGIQAYTVARFHDSSKTNAKELFDWFTKDKKYDTPVAIEPEEAKQRITDKSVLIIVDTHIENNLEDKELFEKADKNRVVIIDHHRKSPVSINIKSICLESNASSASELVTEIIQYFSAKPLLTSLEAEALLAGITLDTRDFVMRAGVSTFEAAAYLKKIGADTIKVKKLFDISIEDKKKKMEIVSSAEIYGERCAVAVVEQDFPRIRVLCSQAADEMLYMKNVVASFTVYPIENGWSISARSLGDVNVQTIMENVLDGHNAGGGHQSMAGAQLYDMELAEVVDKLHKAIDRGLNGSGDNEKQ